MTSTTITKHKSTSSLTSDNLKLVKCRWCFATAPEHSKLLNNNATACVRCAMLYNEIVNNLTLSLRMVVVAQRLKDEAKNRRLKP